jgi:lipooligosaccharide transport system ATP-binding protein
LALHGAEANVGMVEPQPEDGSSGSAAGARGEPAGEVVVAARGLHKEFSGRAVVRRIDFDVRARECLGILGPNGAGKTTTIRMIACQSPIGGGEIRVFGLPVGPQTERAIKARIGIVPQEDNLDPDLSVLTNLLVYATYYGIPRRVAERRAAALLELFALAERAGARIDTLSGGLKRRLTIARGLINEPDLLVLDEPTTGLDPQARHLVWEKLRELGRAGTTMLLTTHYMEEAAQLCDRLLVLDEGRIIAEGAPRELVRRYAGRDVVEVFGETDGLAERCAPLASRVERTPSALRLYLDDERPLAPLLEVLGNRPFLHRAANLEDVFLHLTKRELRD